MQHNVWVMFWVCLFIHGGGGRGYSRKDQEYLPLQTGPGLDLQTWASGTPLGSIRRLFLFDVPSGCTRKENIWVYAIFTCVNIELSLFYRLNILVEDHCAVIGFKLLAEITPVEDFLYPIPDDYKNSAEAIKGEIFQFLGKSSLTLGFGMAEGVGAIHTSEKRCLDHKVWRSLT